MRDLYKIALCQLLVTPDKKNNIRNAEKSIDEAAGNGAGIVCLPEIWNGPYDTKAFGDFAEEESGPSVMFMSDAARRHHIYLIGGSIPEQDNNKRDGDGKPLVYNTSFVFSPSGKIIAKHRKIHLFDVDVENGVRFKESDFFSAGDSLTLFDTDYGKMGLAICFDVRFPDMFQMMAKAGAEIVFLPASFNMTTGPAHWDLLIRSRALDNQFYMAACATARNPDASYTSWGHSCVATPWGDFSAKTDEKESIVYATIDPSYIQKVRNEIPIGNQASS